MNQQNSQYLEQMLGPVDDPVLDLNQLTEDAESAEQTQEEVLRQQAFFGDPPQTPVPLSSEQESLLEDLVVLAAFMDEAL